MTLQSVSASATLSKRKGCLCLPYSTFVGRHCAMVAFGLPIALFPLFHHSDLFASLLLLKKANVALISPHCQMSQFSDAETATELFPPAATAMIRSPSAAPRGSP